MLEICSKLQYYCLVKRLTHAEALNPCHNNDIAVLSAFRTCKEYQRTKKESAALFLFWQRCGTVTECVNLF